LEHFEDVILVVELTEYHEMAKEDFEALQQMHLRFDMDSRFKGRFQSAMDDLAFTEADLPEILGDDHAAFVKAYASPTRDNGLARFCDQHGVDATKLRANAWGKIFGQAFPGPYVYVGEERGWGHNNSFKMMDHLHDKLQASPATKDLKDILQFVKLSDTQSYFISVADDSKDHKQGATFHMPVTDVQKLVDGSWNYPGPPAIQRVNKWSFWNEVVFGNLPAWDGQGELHTELWAQMQANQTTKFSCGGVEVEVSDAETLKAEMVKCASTDLAPEVRKRIVHAFRTQTVNHITKYMTAGRKLIVENNSTRGMLENSPVLLEVMKKMQQSDISKFIADNVLVQAMKGGALGMNYSGLEEVL